MNRRFWLGSGVCVLALVVACSKHSEGPIAPSSASALKINAAPDGTTLKVSAPAAQSPVNGIKLVLNAPVTLVVNNVAPIYVGTSDVKVALTYKFEVYNAAGAKVYTSPSVAAGPGTTSHVLGSPLDFNQAFTWWARAELQGAFGPWSARASFATPPNEVEGYVVGSELYDPLVKGKTIGDIHGAVEFVPGVGLKLLSESSFVSYQLPVTLEEGEMSALITNVGVVSNTEDPKLRVFSMREGDAPFNDNPYRMSVEKRGNGAVAWRFLTGGNRPYIETVSGERFIYSFHESLTYFVQVTWRGNFFNTEFREGGVDGKVVYSFGKYYEGFYGPHPHNIYIGSPYAPGDRGDPGSLTDMIIRHLWVSERPRPDFANK
jgi:hypothetical protein